MSGLLAANMLRSHPVTVYEAQAGLPNNHHALLRFRTDAVANALGIPFKKVRVIKDVHMEGYHSKLSPALSYGMKVASSSGLRSIVSAMEGEVCERFIAPSNLVERMASSLEGNIHYNAQYDVELKLGIESENDSVTISTLPMNALARVLKYDGFKHSRFDTMSGAVITAEIDADVYASLYIPQPELSPYRISVTGSKLIIEYLPDKMRQNVLTTNEGQVEMALAMLGLHEVSYTNVQWKHQTYAKILPIPEEERKRFILWATEQHNVYSLGRYATWRPGLLMDDVVNDVRIIQNMISYGPAGKFYEMRKS